MDIKLTHVARQDLDRLDGSVSDQVTKALRYDLPASFTKDPTFKLAELGTDVRAHTLDDSGLVALYNLRDVDGDGTDEIVVLTIMELSPGIKKGMPFDASKSLIPLQHAPKSARIGHELLHNIGQLET